MSLHAKARQAWWSPRIPALWKQGQGIPRASWLAKLAGIGELQAQGIPSAQQISGS